MFGQPRVGMAVFVGDLAGVRVAVGTAIIVISDLFESWRLLKLLAGLQLHGGQLLNGSRHMTTFAVLDILTEQQRDAFA